MDFMWLLPLLYVTIKKREGLSEKDLPLLFSIWLLALLNNYFLAVVDVDSSGKVVAVGKALSHHVVVSIVALSIL